LRENVKKRLAVVGVWMFFVLYFSIDSLINLRARGVLTPFWQLFYSNFIYFYLWALLSIPIIRVARWLSRKSPKRVMMLLVQLPLGVLFSFFHSVVQFYLNNLIIYVFHPNLSAIFRDENFQIFSLRYFTQNIPMYWIIIGIISLIDYYRLYRENELRSARLELQLLQSQLQIFKMQIHPHFLFNTINSILALMHDDVAGAERMAIQLSGFLRYTLDSIDRQEVLLKEELEFVQRYLDIEKVRLQERLTVTIDVDPDTLLAFVPNFLLQPLVENSVRHGIFPYSRKGHIYIGCKSTGKQLWIQVRDDGPGISPGDPSALKKGVGLTNLEKRLQTLYDKGGYKFTYGNHPEGGAIVDIVIPLHKSQRRDTKSAFS
jgi:two-component system LytT family sensor kinase